jgi:aspartate 1-decarboxylase
MKRSLFKSKLHRATVTHADLSYEGSVTIDETLMRAADIMPYERVHIWNATNGSRLETYALPGPEDSGVVCVNGAAARHAHPGDVVIIATFADAVDEAEARAWRPTVVLLDAGNRIVAGPTQEIPGPTRAANGEFAGRTFPPRGAAARDKPSDTLGD